MPTREQARQGALRSIEVRREDVDRRRAQVAILRLLRPAASAEDLARELRCSPSSIRRDWRALAAAAAKK